MNQGSTQCFLPVRSATFVATDINYRLHRGRLTALFRLDLSTIHIALAYVWAFTTDTADTAIYELFSLENPLPVLYLPEDPISVHRIGFVLKFGYSLARGLPHWDDSIMTMICFQCDCRFYIIHRCYVIWDYKWRAVALLIVAYVFTCTGRIWWISRTAASYLGRRSRRKYLDLTTIMIGSALMYPAALALVIIVYLIPSILEVSMSICLAVCYHIFGVAPTLGEAGAGSGQHEFPVHRGHNTTMELRARGTGEQFEGRGKDTTFFP
ncbi:hypothetical protein DFH08DRAFT_960854 [Mycena albidolilacea]|uniref:Uncharacterized protein n=1 Tax=Mycena albidolilacea TaxID=1033008 RepID=A0AAD7A1B9_9AGAR|nr:hypothetical protein DFH08DRAFT_960854 [Mycena albidolilacea]